MLTAKKNKLRTKMENNENNGAPPCSGCKGTEHMIVETKTVSMKHWHCEYCGTKTNQATTFGKIRPFIGIATLIFFGIKVG